MTMKSSVRDHWEAEVCGSRYGEFERISRLRYAAQPYIFGFADFQGASGKKVLEIGLGTGADFENWVREGADATGVDLTTAAVDTTRRRLECAPLPESSRWQLAQADAEALPFEDASFDIVYSFGVLHHTPNTRAAFREAIRVLRPGGILKAMIYHVPSWVGLMIWLRFGLFRFRPVGPKRAIYEHLESPGTKAYSRPEVRRLLSSLGAVDVSVETRLSPGDLMNFQPSGKHQGRFFSIVHRLYPRPLVRAFGHRFGLHLLIQARKSNGQ